MRGEALFSGRLMTRKLSGKAPLAWHIKNRSRWQYWGGLLGSILAKPFSKLTGCAMLQGSLAVVKIFANGHRQDYGTVGRFKVTDAFVALMVDNLQTDTTAWGDFKYHDSGVGVTGENKTDTDIETTDGESRATGTQTEGATANIYKSVGTIAYTSTKAITEHGLFNTAATATLMDRHTFSAINVVSGDSIEFTYSLTCTSES